MAGESGDAGESGEGGVPGSGGGTLAEGGAANTAGSGNSAGMGNPDPISKDALVYWFSADFGVTETDGAISEWRDRSGNDEHAYQLLTESRPKLEKFAGSDLPAIVFDGQDDYLAMPPLSANFEAGVTFFAVARATADKLCISMLEVSNGREFEELAFFQYKKGFTYEVGDYVVEGLQGPFAVGEPRLLDVTHTPDRAVSLFLNGIDTGGGWIALPITVTRNQNFLGRSLYMACDTTWPGELAEIVLYARALPTEEREAVRLYLSDKWGCCGAT